MNIICHIGLQPASLSSVRVHLLHIVSSVRVHLLHIVSSVRV